MGTFGIILSVVVVVAMLGWLGYRYVKFLGTPEGTWRSGIFGAMYAVSDRIARAKKEIGGDRQQRQAETLKEWEVAFNRYLASISVDVLQEYPGIGPVTVEKLRQGGLTRFDQLLDVPFEFPGIGEKRLQDLRSAIDQHVCDARSRFEAGGCPEAQAAAAHIKEREWATTREIALLEGKIRLFEQLQQKLQPSIAVARRVTFFGYLRKRPVEGLTREMLDTPIETLMNSLMPLVQPNVPDPPAIVLFPNVAPTGSKATARPATAPPILPMTPKPVGASPTDLFRAALDGASAAPVAKPEHPRLPHMRATVEYAFAVAKADGKIARSERDVIRQYLEHAFGHEPELVRWINPLMEQAEKNVPTLDRCLAPMRELFDSSERRGLYALACEIADANGKRNAKEVQCLATIAKAWRFEIIRPPTKAAVAVTPFPVPPPVELTVQPNKAAVPAAPLPVPPPVAPTVSPKTVSRDEYLATLEIPLNTAITADLVRRQYRFLSERNDPAKFESHGADFVKLANDKRHKIEVAATKLLLELHEKLEEEKKPETPTDMRHNPDLDAVFGM